VIPVNGWKFEELGLERGNEDEDESTETHIRYEGANRGEEDVQDIQSSSNLISNGGFIRGQCKVNI
jgi:hypothetical protein